VVVQAVAGFFDDFIADDPAVVALRFAAGAIHFDHAGFAHAPMQADFFRVVRAVGVIRGGIGNIAVRPSIGCVNCIRGILIGTVGIRLGCGGVLIRKVRVLFIQSGVRIDKDGVIFVQRGVRFIQVDVVFICGGVL